MRSRAKPDRDKVERQEKNTFNQRDKKRKKNIFLVGCGKS